MVLINPRVAARWPAGHSCGRAAGAPPTGRPRRSRRPAVPSANAPPATTPNLSVPPTMRDTRLVRVKVISDLHGAVEHIPAAARDADTLVVLGDLINVIDYRSMDG